MRGGVQERATRTAAIRRTVGDGRRGGPGVGTPALRLPNLAAPVGTCPPYYFGRRITRRLFSGCREDYVPVRVEQTESGFCLYQGQPHSQVLVRVAQV